MSFTALVFLPYQELIDSKGLSKLSNIMSREVPLIKVTICLFFKHAGALVVDGMTHPSRPVPFIHPSYSIRLPKPIMCYIFEPLMSRAVKKDLCVHGSAILPISATSAQSVPSAPSSPVIPVSPRQPRQLRQPHKPHQPYKPYYPWHPNKPRLPSTVLIV